MPRQPMTPVEFDAACRLLIHRCPWLSETSGRRSAARNAAVGGHAESKHLIGMARDFVSPNTNGLNQAAIKAKDLALWTKVHDVGSGDHLHVQGLPTGPPPSWWLAKGYGG